MSVLIAKTAGECEQWTDVAVVVDVLRTSTTLCALLARGKKTVLGFDKAEDVTAFTSRHADFEVYSEQKLSVSHEDDSPYAASRASGRTPALVLSNEGMKALFAAKNASTVLVGGFCNFYTLADVLANIDKDVLLVPAALYGTADSVEDGFCVSALKDCVQGIGNPEDAIVEFNNTMRCVEFLKQGPKNAEKDAKIAFKVDDLKVVPQVSFSDQGYAVCYPYGTQAPEAWLVTKPAEQPADVPAQKPVSAAQETVSAPKPAENTKSGLKSFFSGILNTVKEEKRELEQEIANSFGESKVDNAPAPAEDLLDAALKKTPARAAASSGSSVQTPAQQPATKVAVEVQPVAPQQAVPSAEVTFSGKAAVFGSKAKKKAIVLFSGGLDSTTCLYWALAHGYECEALTVSYGQRHDREVLAAQMIARNLGIKHHMITLNLPWLSCCSLVDKSQALPDVALEDIPKEGIPSTYVPGRNLMFLSIAGSLLDAIHADTIIAGPNAIDFSGYPDCTPAFFKAAADALNRGTKMGVTEGIEVLAPLMRMSKTDIVRLAAKLKVPFELTWSCYAGGKKPCGYCDSCKLRAKGFAEAGVHDTSLD